MKIRRKALLMVVKNAEYEEYHRISLPEMRQSMEEREYPWKNIHIL